MRSIKGKKLDPRKKYLNHLRNFFAEKCRDNGIMVEASKRCERGLGGTSRKSAMVQMYNQRGAIPKSDFKLRDRLENEGLTTIEAQKKRNENIRENYFTTAKKRVFSKLGGMLMTSQFQPEKSNK